MRPFILPLVFGVAFTLVNCNLLAVDFSGSLDVVFDNITLFSTNGTSKVRSSLTLELPLLPGDHELTVNNQTEIYHLFDVECGGMGGVSCRVNSTADISLPVEILCGDTFMKTSVFVPYNATTVVSLEGICTSAQVTIGDWTTTVNVTPVFVDQIAGAGPGSVEVYRDGELILNKTVNRDARFPELKPGEYDVRVFPNTNLSGKLVIEGAELAQYKYWVVASLVAVSMGLLFKG